MHSEEIANLLERQSWTRAVAGETDFNNAVKAIELMFRHNLGIIISGEYGNGKTALANAIAGKVSCLRRVPLSIPGAIEMLTPEWENYNACHAEGQSVFIDDLGSELPVNDFGIRREPCGEFIVRYHATKLPNVRLILTTNLSERELDARYGGRVCSRLKDLCVPLRLTGPDKRRWRTA